MYFDHLKKNIGKIEYLMLYPAEGDSSVLEVSAEGFGDFLHVSLDDDGELVFAFFAKQNVTLSQVQMDEISAIARDRLALTYADKLFD